MCWRRIGRRRGRGCGGVVKWPDSRRSLEAIGLTPIEANGLESANRDRPTAVIPTSIPSEDRGNPWTRAGFSLTRQGEIARDNPALAERMKAEAGIK